jgi:hypothetical protein
MKKLTGIEYEETGRSALNSSFLSFFSGFAANSKYDWYLDFTLGTSSLATRCDGAGCAHISAVYPFFSLLRSANLRARRSSFDAAFAARRAAFEFEAVLVPLAFAPSDFFFFPILKVFQLTMIVIPARKRGLVLMQALASTVSRSCNLHQQDMRGACKERMSLNKCRESMNGDEHWSGGRGI